MTKSLYKIEMIELYLSKIAPILGAVLLGQDVKFIGCSTDTRQLKQGSLYIALRGERFDGHDFVMAAQQQGASAIVVEHPIASCDLPMLQVANTRKALGDLARLWRQNFDLPVVAVTGSNGKTTTKEMLRAIFAQQALFQGKKSDETVLANQGNFNNDIGVPLTLFNLNAAHRYAVIEMGANHPGEIANLTNIAQPRVATITQCAPAHLEGFKSVKGVALAKGEIFSNLTTEGIAIINNDDEYATLWQQLATPHVINTFAIENKADIKAVDIQLNNNSSQFTLQTKLATIVV